ncbi:MAG: DUF881 domain-containing protein [Candidatus Limnocylindria bacterium]
MRSAPGGIAVAIIALFLGVLAVSQFRSQDVYSRSLQLETPASLTTLIANLSEKNRLLRAEIFDLTLRIERAGDSVAGGQGSLAETEAEIARLRVLAAESAVEGPGVSITVTGPFDERAMADLVNELRNAGAEAIAINDLRVLPRTHFAGAPGDAVTIDGRRVSGPWTLEALGSAEVIAVAITRTGGIVGQFELIYPSTRFFVSRETILRLQAPTSVR